MYGPDPTQPHHALFDLWQIKSDRVEVFVAVICCPQVGKLCEVGDEIHFILCSIPSWFFGFRPAFDIADMMPHTHM